MPILMVISKQIETEIVVQVSPYGMDVIGIVLNIVIFNKKRMSMQAIIMWLTAFFTTRPSKVNRVKISML